MSDLTLLLAKPFSKALGAAGFGKGPSSTDRAARVSDFCRILMVPSREESGSGSMEKARQWHRRLSAVKMHDSAWGFVRRRSCIDMCRAHSVFWGAQGKGDVSYLSMDLRNFFPSVSDDMVLRSMRAHGFRDGEIEDFVNGCMVRLDGLEPGLEVADCPLGRAALAVMSAARFPVARKAQALVLLFGAATRWADESGTSLGEMSPEGPWRAEGRNPDRGVQDRAPWEHVLLGKILCLGPGLRYGSWVLPQGSPVAPVMSNLASKVMDIRLSAFAAKCGAHYTRYADDMTFSWKGRKTRKSVSLLAWGVSRIVRSEGFEVNPWKTVVMGPGMRQSVLGFAMNSGRPTIPRKKRDEILKAAAAVVAKFVTGDPIGAETERFRVEGSASYVAQAHPGFDDRVRKMMLGGVGEGGIGIVGTMAAHTEEFDGFPDLDPDRVPFLLEEVDHGCM